MCLRAYTCIFRVSVCGFPLGRPSRVASSMAGGRSSSSANGQRRPRSQRPGHLCCSLLGTLLHVAGQRDPVTFSGSCFRSAPSLLRCGIDVTSIAGGLQGFLSSALQSEQLLCARGIVESWCSAIICRALCFAISVPELKLLALGAVF